jgi:PST family polysaccharide transporter
VSWEKNVTDTQSNREQRRILKSTSIIGLSAAVNAAFKILQAKAVALVLGPSGIGLLGLFQSTVSIASTVSGMGLETAGVRDIADASANGDMARVSKTVTAYRRAVWVFGLIGSLLFFCFRRPIAVVTFGNDEHASVLGILAVVPFLAVMSGGRSALIRGMRKIPDLAAASMLGTGGGILIGLPILFFWKEKGLGPYLVIAASTMLFFSWFFARKIRLSSCLMSLMETILEVRCMVSLGIVFMVNGLLDIATLYLVKVYIAHKLGLEVTGLYEASTALSNVYVGFILGAMGADFFPHLSSLSHDDVKSVKLISSQVEIGLLIATPLILIMLCLAPYLLSLLYSDKFSAAFDILRWQSLGTLLRVVTWPLAFLVPARNKPGLFFVLQLAFEIVYLFSIVVGVTAFGMKGIGPAFFVMAMFQFVTLTVVAKRLIKFRWNRDLVKLFGFFFPAVFGVLVGSYLVVEVMLIAVGLTAALGVGIFSFRRLLRLAGGDRIKAFSNRLLCRLKFK